MKNISIRECSFCRVSMQNKDKFSEICEKVKRLINYCTKRKVEIKLLAV